MRAPNTKCILYEVHFFLSLKSSLLLFPGYQKSLEALCNFGLGFSAIEETPKILDPPKNIEDIILSLQHGLLRSATTHSSKGNPSRKNPKGDVN